MLKQLREGWLAMVGRLAFAMLLVAGLGACQRGGPLRQVVQGEELAFYNFTAPGSFEEGAYSAATLRVTGGAYRIEVRQGDATLWWGQWGETFDDVIIEVDVNLISERPEVAYGVMCRVRGTLGQPRSVDPELAALIAGLDEQAADDDTALEANDPTAEAAQEGIAADAPAAETADAAALAVAEPETDPTAEADADAAVTPEATADASPTPTDEPSFYEGDGYVFLVQGSGSYAIMRARGRALTPLVDWTASEHIRAGPGRNTLRAICVGDYLAFYANGQFLADAIDTTYARGQVGLAAGAANRLGVRVEFDNLTVYAAQSG